LIGLAFIAGGTIFFVAKDLIGELLKEALSGLAGAQGEYEPQPLQVGGHSIYLNVSSFEKSIWDNHLRQPFKTSIWDKHFGQPLGTSI
jgi:hypothetical protein